MEETSGHLIKVNLPGGLISPGDLQEVLAIAEKSGAGEVVFGNRQQLFFRVKEALLEDLHHELLMADIHYEVDADEHPNIMSSYVTDDIFDHPGWLREGVYKDIFDLFDHRPKLKVNLVAANQTFVPFFTGNLNFIASEVSNYWFLYVRFPKTNQLYCWPSLIYSEDIPALSKLVESQILDNRNLFYDQPDINAKALLYQKIVGKNSMPVQPIPQPLKLPEFSLPYYEGFNKYGNNKLWLGIYRRNETFAIALLKDICKLCLKTRVGQLHITPWKSLLVKEIAPADRHFWGKILDQHRINVRHASNELNWQLEDNCAEGLHLKQELVKAFEAADLRTYRLCFAIKTHLKSGLFGSVIIRKRPAPETEAPFEILHTPDFNPNNKTLIVYKSHLKQEELGRELIALCDSYYSLSALEEPIATEKPVAESVSNAATYFVYQCKNCLSLYDEAWGDEANGIAAGTGFAALTAYPCPTCDSPKEDFVRIERAAAVFSN
ncbi:MAG: rubredoxin [Mucilaginibacter sp.]|uniref:rubredoxin n=1 Tax=Mucilaginibacter sp. TaxID=1882438 RepID=UPI0034E4893B